MNIRPGIGRVSMEAERVRSSKQNHGLFTVTHSLSCRPGLLVCRDDVFIDAMWPESSRKQKGQHCTRAVHQSDRELDDIERTRAAIRSWSRVILYVLGVI